MMVGALEILREIVRLNAESELDGLCDCDSGAFDEKFPFQSAALQTAIDRARKLLEEASC